MQKEEKTVERKKYLVIVEKRYIARIFDKLLAEMENEGVLNADIDVIPANNHVVNTNSRFGIMVGEGCEVGALELKDRVVPENYKLVTSAHMDAIGSIALMLVQQNNYDVVVNACDIDAEGDLKFRYMIESLGLDKCEQRRMVIAYLTENNISNALHNLIIS
jgi:DNA topoisomerase IA